MGVGLPPTAPTVAVAVGVRVAAVAAGSVGSSVEAGGLAVPVAASTIA